MTPTAAELAKQARITANAYATLEEHKWTPKRPQHVRKMKQEQGPRSPAPDGDFVFNLTEQLLGEKVNKQGEEEVPGGLTIMARDALSYTPAPRHTTKGDGYLDPARGGLLCAHISRQAPTIVERFPAATELMELLGEQANYIHDQIIRRWGTSKGRPEARHNSTVITRMLSQQNIHISRQTLHNWAERGHISRQNNQHGRGMYLLSEVIAHASKPITQNTQ